MIHSLRRNFICITCGTQYPQTDSPPESCPICLDERQYVGLNGQEWTTLEELSATHRNEIQELEPGLHAILTQPKFAIGQRAFLLQTPAGNLLWDCISLLDDRTVELVGKLGGVDAIAVSHPHYYSSMIAWSRAFHHAPIYLHEADANWVMFPDESIRFWSGSTYAWNDRITLIHCGGHFDGFQVLCRQTDGGVLLAGDQPQVCLDRRWVSFMYSYPNFIPLPARAVERIHQTLSPYAYDRLYGAFPFQNLRQGAKEIVERSVARYLRNISE